jgi:CRISPR/Cas system CSM-associated protein Csm4 (group 5 of RAMP superfamily)
LLLRINIIDSKRKIVNANRQKLIIKSCRNLKTKLKIKLKNNIRIKQVVKIERILVIVVYSILEILFLIKTQEV